MSDKYKKFLHGKNKLEYMKKLRAAYREYAPKNQSFDDFIAMFESEEKLDSTIASWGSWSDFLTERSKKLKDLDMQYQKMRWKEKINNLVTAFGFNPVYQDVIDIKNEIFVLASYTSPYSTFNPKLGKQIKEFDKKTDRDIKKEIRVRIKELQSHVSEKNIHEYQQAKQELHMLQNQLQELNNTTKKDRHNRMLLTGVSDKIKQRIAVERHKEIIEIIASDDELFEMAGRWNSLNKKEFAFWIQKVVNKLDEKYYGTVTSVFTPKVILKSEIFTMAGARANFWFNALMWKKTFDLDTTVNAIKHEYGHRIDHYMPDMGMLGSQISKKAVKADKSGKSFKQKYDAYLHHPTEVSSYFIGDYDVKNIYKQLCDWRKKHGLSVSNDYTVALINQHRQRD